MKTQSAFEYGYGIDVRCIPHVAKVLSEIFLNLTGEERITYSALFLCTRINSEIVRFDHELTALCVGPITMDMYMNDAQCARLFVMLISSKTDEMAVFRSATYEMINNNWSVSDIRAKMLTAAKETLEDKAVEGFC